MVSQLLLGGARPYYAVKLIDVAAQEGLQRGGGPSLNLTAVKLSALTINCDFN